MKNCYFRFKRLKKNGISDNVYAYGTYLEAAEYLEFLNKFLKTYKFRCAKISQKKAQDDSKDWTGNFNIFKLDKIIKEWNKFNY